MITIEVDRREEFSTQPKYVVYGAELRCLFGETTSIMENGGSGYNIHGRELFTVNDIDVGSFEYCYSPFNREVVLETVAEDPIEGITNVTTALANATAAIAEGEGLIVDEFLKDYTDIEGVDKLKKVPCMPIITEAWLNGMETSEYGGVQALLDISVNLCEHCGLIIILDDGQ